MLYLFHQYLFPNGGILNLGVPLCRFGGWKILPISNCLLRLLYDPNLCLHYLCHRSFFGNLVTLWLVLLHHFMKRLFLRKPSSLCFACIVQILVQGIFRCEEGSLLLLFQVGNFRYNIRVALVVDGSLHRRLGVLGDRDFQGFTTITDFNFSGTKTIISAPLKFCTNVFVYCASFLGILSKQRQTRNMGLEHLTSSTYFGRHCRATTFSNTM